MKVEPLRAYETQILATVIHQPEYRYMIFTQIQSKHLTKTRTYYKLCEELFEKNPEFDWFDVEQAIDNSNGAKLPADFVSQALYREDLLDLRIQELQENYSKRQFFDLIRKAGSEINEKELTELLDMVNSVEIDSNTVEGANVPDTLKEMEEKGDREPLITNNPVLNEMYDNMQNQLGTTELILADAKHGKTSYAIWKAAEFAKCGEAGLYITLENSRQAIALKFANQMNRCEEMKNVHIIDTRDGITDLQSILYRIRYYKSKYKIKWVCVDYIQRVEIPGLSRFDRIEKASNKLTDEANKTNFFGMFLSQPHNISDQRKGYKRMPTVHDADGAGALRKDPFVITGVFRPRLVEELVIKDQNVDMFCRGFGGDQIPLNSVIVKQLIVRDGEVYSKPIMLEHKDQGLVLPSKREESAPF